MQALMILKICKTSIVLLILLSGYSHAEGYSVSLHGSPEGSGLEFTGKYSDQVNVRLGYHRYAFQGTDLVGLLNMLNMAGILKRESTYDHNEKQQIVSAFADWYLPGAGQFRMSVGLVNNKSIDKLTGRAAVLGGYTINGTHYSAGEVGNLSGTITYNKLAPYFGYGWGNQVKNDKSWGVTIDAGVIYQGKPKVTLNATGATANLQSDLVGEQNKLRNDSYVLAPLVSVGVTYQFY
jgi:hypothetical protein